MEWVGSLIMTVGSVLVAAIGIIVGKGASSAQKNVATIERTGPDWDAFMERIEKHHENSIGQLNGRIDRLQNKVQRLEDKLAEKDEVIEQKDALLEAQGKKYDLATAHLSRWQYKYPDDPLVKSTPYELREDIHTYWPRDEPQN